MGLIEKEPAQLESNIVEQLKASGELDQDRKSDPLAPDNYQMDHEWLDNGTVEQKEMNEAQNVNKALVSAQEKSDEIGVIGLNDGEMPLSEDTKTQEPALENMKRNLDSKYLEVASQNGHTGHERVGIPPGVVSVDPGVGELAPVMLEATNDSVLLENDDRGSSGQQRKTIAKLKSPVSSSWVLRSKLRKVPEPIESVKEEDCSNAVKNRKVRKRKKLPKSTANEFSRTRNHLRYLLNRIKYEQTLIDAYSAEGWRGQSLEKLKPEKELEKAKSHILRYKLKIRALFQHIDQSLTVGKIPESLFDSLGEIDSEDIFCAKCGSKDLTLDNDIILCDGACERGFHQFCLEPPLLKKDIPPGDQSWLCPGCECKADCIDILKDIQGTKISIIDSWEKIFPEAANASGKKMDDGSGSSDDSEDEEYDPDKPDSSEKFEDDKSSSDESSKSAPNLAASHNNEQYLGLPSDDSEDDDFDPSSLDQDNQVKQDSSSSDFTSDSEDLEGLIEDETASEDPCKTSSPEHHKKEPVSCNEEILNVGRKKRQSLKDELSFLMETSAEPLSVKRHVERLDYKKLNDETYGYSSDSSDEDFDDTMDFDDTITRKRRKSDREEIEVKSSKKTLVAQSDTHKEDENQIEEKHFPRRTRRNHTDGDPNESSVKAVSASTDARKSTHRQLSEATTQRLYESFNVNQFPDRATKENLAKELGLTFLQVRKWFDNTRWSFNHRPRLESGLAERQPEPKPTIGADGTHSNHNVESNAIPAQNHFAKRKKKSA